MIKFICPLQLVTHNYINASFLPSHFCQVLAQGTEQENSRKSADAGNNLAPLNHSSVGKVRWYQNVRPLPQAQ